MTASRQWLGALPRSVAWYLGLLGLVAIERLVELAISKRNTRRALADGAVELGQRHFPAMATLHTVFLLACGIEVVALHRPVLRWVGPVALCGVVAAQLVRYWVVSTLGPRWSVRVVVYPEGHGKVEPVTAGPYRYLRHPNYLAVVVELLCLPLVHGAWLTALLFSALNGWLLIVRIRVEERALGATYRARFASVRRFWPGSPTRS